MWVTLLHHLTCMIYIPRKETPVMLLSAVIRILRFRSSTMPVVFEAVQVYLWDPGNREPRCATSVCSFASLLDGLITSLAMLLTNLGKWDVHELFSWETQCWIQYSSGSLSSLAVMGCKSSLFHSLLGVLALSCGPVKNAWAGRVTFTNSMSQYICLRSTSYRCFLLWPLGGVGN